MSHQDNLDASFKGVPFFVESEGLTDFGRNLAISEVALLI
jgi:prophage DNA circulation protein